MTRCSDCRLWHSRGSAACGSRSGRLASTWAAVAAGVDVEAIHRGHVASRRLVPPHLGMFQCFLEK